MTVEFVIMFSFCPLLHNGTGFCGAFDAALTKTCFLVSRFHNVAMQFTVVIAVRCFYNLSRVLTGSVRNERCTCNDIL